MHRGKAVFRFTLITLALIAFLVTFAHQREAVAQTATLEAGTIAVDPAGFEMVYLPASTFTVGIDSNRLRQLCPILGESDVERCVQTVQEQTGATYTYTVQIQAFWIDRYEVTIERFTQACTVDYIWFPEGCIDRQLPPEVTEDPNQPQLGVTYTDAIAFCGARTARLPTEAEWEYAASGPDKLLYPWGNEFNRDYLHSDGDTYPPSRTYPVGSVPENQSWVGAYDMAGNAAEWVEDRFLPHILDNISIDEIPLNASYGEFDIDVRRVIRGGSWEGRLWPLTTFYREAEPPQTLSWWVGFRCARTLNPEG